VAFDSTSVLAWYERVKRPLPWRQTRDPYALLVSEVMLQQTQAQRVVPYYEAFLDAFPDPPSLAAAAPSAVLKAWSGLGYNRRALALQQAARRVAAYGWPDDLTELPGVGPYTAAAVGSFAWDRQDPAIDTNFKRVIERFDGVTQPPAALARRARALVPAGGAAAFNQAMMELGATVCRPRRPVCAACPVRAGCRAQGPRVAADGEGPRRGGAPDAERGGRRNRIRFEDTDRWARGRLLAALVAGEPPPALEAARRERALAGLERDGLVVRGADGEPRPP
jgi:A/G-specific adenine glycosylase